MRKTLFIAFLLCLAMRLQAQVVFETAFPQAGQSVAFSYTPQADLVNAQEIEIYAYLNDGTTKKPAMQKLSLEKAGKIWKGQIPTQTDTKSILLAIFEAGTIKTDNNNNKGYTQILYDAKKKPLSRAYASLAIAKNFLYFLDISEKQYEEWMRQEFKNFPENKYRYFNAYAKIILNNDKQKAQKELQNLEKRKNIDEDEMEVIYWFYRNKKDKAKTEEWEKKILARNPKHPIAELEYIIPIYSETDAQKRLELIKAFLGKFPNSTQKNKFEAKLYWEEIKEAAKNKDTSRVQELLTNAPPKLHESLSIDCNNYAWDLAEKSENLEIAEILSKFAVEVQRKIIANPKEEEIYPKAFMKVDAQNSLGMFLDTYGWVLYKQERYLEALGAFREAISINERNQKDTEYLERYFLAQDKAEKMLLENLAKAGKAGKEHKARLRKLYIAEKQSEDGFEEYFSAMEMQAQKEAQERIMKKLINQKAPNFEIKDLAGKTVTLKSLQGKIVVIDFWATWCGPCIMSFPGMQQVVNQYKDNKEVVFLFVGTMDKEDNVKQWAEKNKEKYSFYVLYDEGNKVADAFGVNGIPHKFVLDKKGQIRFSSIGFNGSAEATRSEMEIMIETVKKQ
jgi:peroxiredoxin